MRRRAIVVAWVAFAVACGSGKAPEAEEGAVTAPSSATSGGETAWAKEVPPEAAPAHEPTPEEPAPAPTVVAPPTIVQFAEGGGSKPRTPPGGASVWGDPEGQCANPLPPRKPIDAAAANELKEGAGFANRFEHGKARKAFERALAADAGSYEAAYDLGVIADREGNPNLALQHYRKALSLQADYERAAEGIARVHLRHGAASTAVAEIEPLARRWECNLYLQALIAELYVVVGRVDEAERTARKVLRRDERFVPAMIALARASLARGRRELADSMLEQASAVDADQPDVHFMRGQAFERDGRLLDALQAYRRAVELRPEHAEARMALGVRALASGNYEEAREHLEATASLVPTLVAVRLNLGDAYRANRQWKKAKQTFDEALGMQKVLPEAHFNLGLMYMSAGAEFPGMTMLSSLERALVEFAQYRSEMGSRLARDDPSAGYIADIERQIDREKKRIEREERRKAQEADRGARTEVQ